MASMLAPLKPLEANSSIAALMIRARFASGAFGLHMAAFRPRGSPASGDNGAVPAAFMAQGSLELTKLQIKLSRLVNSRQLRAPMPAAVFEPSAGDRLLVVERAWGQMRGLGPDVDRPASPRDPNPIDPAVRDRERARQLERDVLRPAIDHAEHPAVGDDRDRRSGVRARESVERHDDAVAELRAALASGHEVFGVARDEASVRRGVRALDLGPGQALQLAIAAFAEPRVRDDVAPEARRDRRRRLAGAAEVARHQELDALVREPRGERRGLSAPGVGQRAGLPTLPPAPAVPDRLAVAQEEEARHRA